MYDFNLFTKELKKLLTQERFEHVERVRQKAIELSKIYNAPTDIIEVGAYLHDIAKYFDNDLAYNMIEPEYRIFCENEFKINQILHGFAGASYVKEKFNIKDERILNSIRFHTIGSKNMTLIDKIVYLADAIEDGRDYPRVQEIRKLANEDINKAIIFEIENKLIHLINKKSLIHPNTIEFRNSLIKEMESKNE